MSTGQGSLAGLLQKDISVISIRDIRYEGKLYSYDSDNFTITLQNVRNMGTEDRITSMQVPPTDTAYEFIVFNANHIKSFQPITRPKRVADPAIVTFVTDCSQSASISARVSPKKAPTVKPEAPLMKMFGSQRVLTVDLDRLMERGENAGKTRQRSSGRGQRQQATTGVKDTPKSSQQSSRQTNQGATKAGKRKSQKGANNKGAQDGDKTDKQGGASPTKGARRVSFKEGDQGSERRHIPQIPRGLMTRSTKESSAGRTSNGSQDANRSSGSSSSRRRSSVQLAKPGQFVASKSTVQFSSEYDFDKAFEEFKELTVVDKSKEKTKDAEGIKETTEGNGEAITVSETVEPPKECYNREKGFYDNLSTTAETENQPRLTRKERIEANKETFGEHWVPGRRRFHSRRNYNGGLTRQRQQATSNDSGSNNNHRNSPRAGQAVFGQRNRNGGLSGGRPHHPHVLSIVRH